VFGNVTEQRRSVMNEEASEMPKLSKETASGGADYGAVVDRGGELEGYHVGLPAISRSSTNRAPSTSSSVRQSSSGR